MSQTCLRMNNISVFIKVLTNMAIIKNYDEKYMCNLWTKFLNCKYLYSFFAKFMCNIDEIEIHFL